MNWTEVYAPIIHKFLEAPIESVVKLCGEGINNAVKSEKMRCRRIIEKEYLIVLEYYNSLPKEVKNAVDRSLLINFADKICNKIMNEGE